MSNPTKIYDLMLLLSREASDEVRASVLADVERRITQAGGSIERNDSWGTRPLTFPIEHQTEAEYHLLQFTAPPTLLEGLSHDLGIMDGVLRHRIIKVVPGTPPAPSTPPPVLAVAQAGSPSDVGDDE
jgi:small subunit ribosomal protein S6